MTEKTKVDDNVFQTEKPKTEVKVVEKIDLPNTPSSYQPKKNRGYKK